MSVTGLDRSGRRMDQWKQVFRSISLLTGWFAPGPGTGTSSAGAQENAYRSAESAPTAWREFAARLQRRFQDRLAAGDTVICQLRDDLAKRGACATGFIVARTWVLPDGVIERIEFDGLDNLGIADNLRALLMHDGDKAPPSDMLQPLHLRLSLRPRDEPQQWQQ